MCWSDGQGEHKFKLVIYYFFLLNLYWTLPVCQALRENITSHSLLIGRLKGGKDLNTAPLPLSWGERNILILWQLTLGWRGQFGAEKGLKEKKQGKISKIIPTLEKSRGIGYKQVCRIWGQIHFSISE